ncbi:hypothetical protein B0H13DRAFT_2029026 [Mycena leptocephala]|nr:hypothetical protein B0H13DRAFT_2029026 [Mycena leptocephala]
MGLACAMRRRSARASDVLPGSSERAVLPSDTRTQDARRARKGQGPRASPRGLLYVWRPLRGTKVLPYVRLERERKRTPLSSAKHAPLERHARARSLGYATNGGSDVSETPALRSSTQLRPRGRRTHSATPCSLLPSAFFCTDAPRLLAPLEIRIMVMRLPTSLFWVVLGNVDQCRSTHTGRRRSRSRSWCN